MSNSYRIRTQTGINKSIQVLIDQEFEYIEILSLKLLQSQIYTRQCSDYGVVAGRVSVNNGFGIPNAKVSIFIPLSDEDESNPIISEIYPYKTSESINEDGYRYNLLPYVPSYPGHAATGTFFDRDDVIYDNALIEVYDKYYKYTTVTNNSGDYMIFGVPTGPQTIFVDMDLSDIGEFSLTPNDLIRMGRATEEMVNGTSFKTGQNLNVLPQIVSFNRNIEVQPLWGQPEICDLGINRSDFDITKELGIDIKPTSVFMGSILTDTDDYHVKKSCRPKNKTGYLCSLTTGPGTIRSIRQTIDFDNQGRPILEKYVLPNGGQIIDEDGTWVIDVPMNLDYVTTDEFGNQVISNDPNVGIPTKGKYRFKVKWNQPTDITLNIRRANFLVPNIREYGYTDGDNGWTDADPALLESSYAFSLNWDDYGDATPTGQAYINDAINCVDKFYEMRYNKVYSVSNLITQFKGGSNRRRIIAIKHILDEVCESNNYKFPTNDAQLKPDFTFSLIVFLMGILYALGSILLIVIHVLAFIVCTILAIFAALVQGIASIFQGLANLADSIGFDGLAGKLQTMADKLNNFADKILGLCYNFKISLCLMTYPDCESCERDEVSYSAEPTPLTPDFGDTADTTFLGVISQISDQSKYICGSPTDAPLLASIVAGAPQTSISSTDYKAVGILPGPASDELFSSNLTLPHRINLFNTKGKYFDSTIVPGGGVNQIEVKFCPSLNPGVSHLDNVICLIIREDKISDFTEGNIMTFNDPKLSKDPNLTGSTLNIYGNNSITGSTTTTFNPISQVYEYTRVVDYADPLNGGNISTPPYTLTATSVTNLYAKYAMDNEYYQVIHKTTISTFLTNAGTEPNSLPNRFINNDYYYLQIENGFINCETANTLPYNCFENFDNQYLVFLVRGVDPNSDKVECSYDLSKIYGYTNFGDYPGGLITGEYKLNIPIQGTTKCVKHNSPQISVDSSDVDTYSSTNLFYDSYQFIPSPTQFIPFTTDLPKYYSNLDLTTSLSYPAAYPGPDGGLCVINTNNMTKEWNSGPINIGPGCDIYLDTPNSGLNNRGYFANEPVEGGSLLYLDVVLPPSSPISDTSVLISDIYSSVSISYNLGSSGRQIVMRSDRLPSSSLLETFLTNEYVLMENTNFYVFVLNEGQVISIPSPTPSSGSNDVDDVNSDISGSTPNNAILLDTFQCTNMVPLECYESLPDGTIGVKPEGDPCYSTLLGSPIMQNGCYLFVQDPIVSLPGDLDRFPQWIGRLMAIFAACRGVFSHMFTNNWINGTLYMFPFKNDTFFDSNNVANLQYCQNVIYFNPKDKNFYYRSSPYTDTGNFIGQEGQSPVDGNSRDLLFPTTMIDLGPKLEFLKFVSNTGAFDDYIVGEMLSTSYQDVSDILNLFLIGRMISSSNPGGVYSYFQRTNRMVDGDYAQMISINSEFGVKQFDSASYNGTDIYVNGGVYNNIIGIFFQSNLQNRDYISPKRTILSGSQPATSTCAFDNLTVFSQEVPFYQWRIVNQATPYSIFGTQGSNNWQTNYTTSFKKYKYQELDRLNSNSGYMRTTNTTQTDYYKGYIYGVDGSGAVSPDPNDVDGWISGTNNGNDFTTGAPFHFYFGLRQGKNAFNKFANIWISNIEED